MEFVFFESLLLILCGSLAAAMLFRRFKLPTIVAYIVLGATIGPHALGLIENPKSFEFVAELGVVLLLFSLGLEFSLPKLMAAKSDVFGLGAIQVIACMLVFSIAVWFWGNNWGQAFVIAGALALSSTAIVTRELTQRRTAGSYHGRISISILLFQDLVAIVFLVMVPVMGGAQDQPFIHVLAIAFAKGVLLFIILMSVGKWVLPFIYSEISRTDSDEIFVLATLVICLLSAWITHSFHLSMALGGFVTGMMLGESPFRHQIEADIRPFKDILLGLFFVVIGMNTDLSIFLQYWPRLLLFTLCLMVIKCVVVTLAVCLKGHTLVEAIKVGLNLAQAGEFALALLTLALLSGVLPQEQASFILMIAILSMVVSPLLIGQADKIANWLGLKLKFAHAHDVSGTHQNPEEK